MKFGKLSILAVFVFISSALFAQDYVDMKTNDWFFGAGGGLNIGFDGHKYVNRKNSHKGSGTAVEVYFGKYFTKTVGFRLGYHGISSSNQYKKYGKDEFHYAHADILFRVGNVLVPYIHGGYVGLANKETAGFGVGLMLPIRLNRTFSIVPDLKATALSSARFTTGTKRMGMNLSGTIGLRISLAGGKPRPKPQAPVVVPPVPVRDTIVVIQKDTVYVSQKDTSVVINKDTVVIEKPELPVPKTSLVYFRVGKFVLDENSREILDNYSAYLLSAPDVKITIEGHASSEGSAALNQTLSQRRANVVREYLAKKGVSTSRMTTKALGSSQPIEDNSTEAGRRLNRRAVVVIED